MVQSLGAFLQQIRQLARRPRAGGTRKETEPDEVMVLFAEAGSPLLREHPGWQRRAGSDREPGRCS